jgi:hypothetical protein
MIARMGRLSEHHKIPSRTAPEILEAFNDVLGRFERSRSVVFYGRKLSGEALLAAILLDYLDKPPAEQDRIVMDNVPRFVAILEGEPDPGPARASAAPDAVFPDGPVAQEEGPPSARRGKKGG